MRLKSPMIYENTSGKAKLFFTEKCQLIKFKGIKLEMLQLLVS